MRCKDCKWWQQTDLREGISNPSGKCNKPGYGSDDGWGNHAKAQVCSAFVGREVVETVIYVGVVEMDRSDEEQIEGELAELYEKKVTQGWTQRDVDRKNFLEDLLEIAE